MNPITLFPNTYIALESADLISANAPFYHVDRIAPFHVLIYCIKGCINVSEDDISYSIQPGECLILKSGHHQKPTSLIREGSSWIYAHFYTKDIPLDLVIQSSVIDNSERILIPQYTKNLKNTKSEELLYRFAQNIHSENISDRLLISSLFREILVSLYDESIEHKKPELYEQIQDYLSENIHAQISTKDLEKHFHLSYKYMESVFKKHVGIPILQYHIKLRINDSAKTLRSSTLSVFEISELYGFHDQLYFSRCFKKHMGVSPQKYRIHQIII